MEKLIQVFCTVAAAALLAGCSGKSEDKIPGPVAFDKHDRCHICGMVILNYPGAKAQVFVKGEKEPLKFCSVKDGFVYVLQPENAKRTVAFWVSDFGNKKDIPLTFAERWANRFFRSLPKKKFKPLRKSTAEQL